MVVLGVDIESSGLNTGTDRIIEIGAIPFDPVKKSFLNPVLSTFIYDETIPPLSDKITELTGIDDGMLRSFGISPKLALQQFVDLANKCDYLIGHNALGFDKPFLITECARHGVQPPDSLWLDTLTDLPYPGHITSRKLLYLLADHGISWNQGLAHRALFDVQAALLLLSKYDFSEVLEYASQPDVLLRAVNIKPPWEDGGIMNSKVKARRFSWQDLGDGSKGWLKRIKKNQLQKEIDNADFEVQVYEERRSQLSVGDGPRNADAWPSPPGWSSPQPSHPGQ
jgi:DNA polymerase III subunit epsilon